MTCLCGDTCARCQRLMKEAEYWMKLSNKEISFIQYEELMRGLKYNYKY